MLIIVVKANDFQLENRGDVHKGKECIKDQ
jgi:hypothetical protein